LNNIGNADLKLLKEIYQDRFNEAEELLKKNYPIQYLIGYVEFYNTIIHVNENCLIPRFETENLISLTIPILKEKNIKSLIDICTGSGCIAIALKHALNLDISACDISIKALNLAQINAQKNNTPINFFQIDILNETIKGKYDCIISNPPYVKEDEETSLETKYEPSIALYAKYSGLEFYKRILSEAPNILNKNGIIIFEIGNTLGLEIKKIALHYFPEASIIIKKDFNNYDRYIFIYT